MSEQEPDLIQGEDGKFRCFWPGVDPFYQQYHDAEWGRPVMDDRRLFEKICLEGFQSGLSWLTILRKRENFRAAFDNFDAEKAAVYGDAEIARLVADAGIVRHRGKIVSTINNANRALELKKEFGSLAAFFWSYEPQPKDRPAKITRASIPGSTEISTAISKALKKRGWSFVGPTTVYAFMQAMGMVNDHIEGCFCQAEAEAERAAFKRPS
ncbi:DNA-3-methyladenine glycosylase I [Mesorhizobium sp. NBSH29]|uniref:DNA-3-methyladenine glycosylase I n=1 Tax=Mesorhizobium sp. NBSH29 TaxID=2654249 RepID=UPI00189673DB|nr:DNA-3-methyladenine glycosylase I [Mesorhizobium sp. NBSH29]QPC86836.1 DNA-3-methyladenine glycosylase I [Mesorhizobium sp. NBSH29]